MKPLKLIYYATLGVIALLAVLLIFSTFPIPGNYKLFVVQSGSMQPAIQLGSIVVVKPVVEYKKDDIISYENRENPGNIITHRVFEVKEEKGVSSYITKGDANEEPDERAILGREVIGKVLFSVPFVGYGVAATRQPVGFMVLIILPATLIIYDEIRKIKDEVVKLRRKKTLLFLLILSTTLLTFNFTRAYLADTETSMGNIFQVTTWEVWKQTTKDDFESGTLSNVDTTTSPDNVMLTGAYPVYGDTVALWHLNESDGTTAEDATGNDNDGTLNGDPSWVVGKHSNGLEFDGDGDYVGVPHSASLDITGNITIEAWVKIVDIPDTYSAVVSKGASHPGSYMLHLDERSGTTFRVCPVFYISGSYGNWQVGCSSDLNYGQWYHVAVTYDGSDEKTFVNGNPDGQEARAGAIDSTSDPVEIGHDSRYSVGTRHVNGIIDEVRISNTAKTSFPVDYFSSGTLESQVFNGGGTRDWDLLEWVAVLPADTEIELEVATSDVGSDDDGPDWTWWPSSFTDSPVDLGSLPLPDSQYIKWKATLTTTDSGATPTLEEVKIRHFASP